MNLLFIHLSGAASLSHRDALFAKRAVLWLVGLDVEVQQGRARDVTEADFAAAAVDEHADGDGNTAVGLDDIDDFLDGAAGRDDVFDDQAALTRMQVEAAAEGHLAIDALGEDGARAESLARLMGEQDAAGHRADDGLDVGVLELLGHRLAELLRVLWMLQHVELLDVVRAMQAGRQQEMAIHDGVRLDQQVFYFFFGHCHFTVSISFKIASAAAFGSSAARIGRPMTRWLAPFVRALAGVAMRL